MNFIFYTRKKIRLDELLRCELPSRFDNDKKHQFSNSKIRRLILAGAVFVEKKQIRRPAYNVLKGCEVKVYFDEKKFFFEKQPDDIKFNLTPKDVLFEDDFLILVNKPAFFPVEETLSGQEKRDNLHDAIVRYLWKKNPDLRNPPYCGIMHRLDRETSGVILFTKQRTVNKAIHNMFENHNFTKIYNTICCIRNDNIEKIPPKFTVENYIGRITPKSKAAKWGTLHKEKGGLYSKTDFLNCGIVNINSKNYLALQASPITGRTHQIRVHLSEKGLPILGDTLYGGDKANRLMLHASSLEFTHPVTEKTIKVCALCEWKL